MSKSWKTIDLQMQKYTDRLVGEVGLPLETASTLATSVTENLQILPADQKAKIRNSSPVPLVDRLAELEAFQSFMEFAGTRHSESSLIRAQVICQSYICFVYLPEACFSVLAKECKTGSAARKCATFLRSNKIRSYRNAIAHANWTYRPDFQAIIYWARKGEDKTAPLEKFEVMQEELGFWQALSRTVAYVTYLNVM